MKTLKNQKFSTYIGDIWDLSAHCIVVPVNLSGVMGRGIAKQAKDKYPKLQPWYKRILEENWNFCKGLPCYYIPNQCSLFLFPVKHGWRDMASLDLITSSAHGLVESISGSCDIGGGVALPHVGCGFGELDWEIVREVLLPILKPVASSVILVIPSPSVKKKYPEAFAHSYRQDRSI